MGGEGGVWGRARRVRRRGEKLGEGEELGGGGGVRGGVGRSWGEGHGWGGVGARGGVGELECRVGEGHGWGGVGARGGVERVRGGGEERGKECYEVSHEGHVMEEGISTLIAR